MRVRHLALPIAASFLACSSGGHNAAGEGQGSSQRTPRTYKDQRGQQRVPADRQPTQEELDAAFADEAPVPKAAASLGGTPVRAPEPAPDPAKEAQAAFEAAAAAVQALLAQKSPEALPAAAALVGSARTLPPPQLQRALRLAVGAARQQKDEEAAFASAWEWVLACGPAEADRCRKEALAAAAASPQGAARVQQARNADSCLRAAEAAARKKGEPLPACLPAAGGTYRAQKDGLMGARAHLAQAESSARAEAPEAAYRLQRAADHCVEPRCLEVRRRALQRLANLQLSKKAAEAGAKAAFADMALHQQALPAASRPYAWTELVDRACRALDAERGPGSCRKLERASLGSHAFTDFSAPPPKGEGLDPEQVRLVNAHYEVSFQDCLAQEASRLVPPSYERYTVRWSVGNDGKVAQMQMDRQELQQSVLAGCLREQLVHWRYPRFYGELQHVEQTFLVSATRR